MVVDAGLLLYWAAVLLNLIPENLRFKDYSNQVIQAWNWSFFPLDVAAALTVFLGARWVLGVDAPLVGGVLCVWGSV